jgi:AcrR family transcriptional regulator
MSEEEADVPPSVRIPPPVRVRRSHAERTAETRDRVMMAVVESIAEIGYQKTTATRIAQRAGLSWGAVQHHFGDKDGILMAVLEESFRRFAEALNGGPGPDVALEVRVSRFVDRSWEHFSGPHYRSTFEILLNLPSDLEIAWQGQMLEAWMRIWSEYFPESQTSQKRTVDLMYYAISVFSGLATTKILEGPKASERSAALGYLKETLRRELSRNGTPK